MFIDRHQFGNGKFAQWKFHKVESSTEQFFISSIIVEKDFER